MKIDVKNEEMKMVLEEVPSWIFRWGTTVLFISLSILITLSVFIKYPDTITADFLLTTKVAPATLVTRSAGTLELFVEDNQQVVKDDLIGVIQNSASTNDVFFLVEIMGKVGVDLDVINIYDFDDLKPLELGDIQNAYLEFHNSIEDLNLFHSVGTYADRIVHFKKEIEKLMKLDQIQENRILINEKELTIGKKRLDRQKGLYDSGVISEQDFENSESDFLRLQKTIEQERTNKLNNEIQILKLKASISNLELEKVEEGTIKRDNFKRNYINLANQINEWREKYCLISPIEGRVELNRFWSNSQYIRSGEDVLNILPKDSIAYGVAFAPVARSSKLEIGQTVYIKFDNYDVSEVGRVRGIIRELSDLPIDGKYLIRVELPTSLITDYNKTLEFKQEMTGIAEIVTKDRTVFDRLFYRLRSLLTVN